MASGGDGGPPQMVTTIHREPEKMAFLTLAYFVHNFHQLANRKSISYDFPSALLSTISLLLANNIMITA